MLEWSIKEVIRFSYFSFADKNPSIAFMTIEAKDTKVNVLYVNRLSFFLRLSLLVHDCFGYKCKIFNSP